MNSRDLLVVCGITAEELLSYTYGLRTSYLPLHVIMTSLPQPRVNKQEAITSIELLEYHGYSLQISTPVQIQYKVLWTSTCDTTATE